MSKYNELVEKIMRNPTQEPEEINLFDPEYQRKEKEELRKRLFKAQDEWANRSEVFKRILQSETSDDPEERVRRTNHSKAKTRNALISRSAYPTDEAWENNLLKNPFYGLTTK